MSPDDVEKSMPQMVLSTAPSVFSMMEKAMAGYLENSQAFNSTPGPAEFAGPDAANCSYLEKIVLVVEPI